MKLKVTYWRRIQPSSDASDIVIRDYWQGGRMSGFRRLRRLVREGTVSEIRVRALEEFPLEIRELVMFLEECDRHNVAVVINGRQLPMGLVKLLADCDRAHRAEARAVRRLIARQCGVRFGRPPKGGNHALHT
jgi:hypothetical protein